MSRLVFAGHNSFPCKQFWLKKGYDYIKAEKRFSDDTAVVALGVGKNMVHSIRFWLDAFGISENKETATALGDYLFGTEGRDPFLEDIGSVWLLHYHLVRMGNASIYSLMFNDFRKGRDEFDKEQLHNFLKIRCNEQSAKFYNENTIDRDIRVFIANYMKPQNRRAEIEDAYSSLLHELNLLGQTKKEKISKKNAKGIEIIDWYSIKSQERAELPYHIVLFSILDNEEYSTSISFRDLEVAPNSPGRVFALSPNGVYAKIQEIIEHYPEITYSETAGNRTLQINFDINKWDILNDYYQQK